MSHRNSKPKPHASERTWRRHRAYHDISTIQDKAHFKKIDEIKSQILEWFGKKSPQIELPVMSGSR